jgi:hypothetical protein
VVEGARLERVYGVTAIVGSNPTLSAMHSLTFVQSVNVPLCVRSRGLLHKNDLERRAIRGRPAPKKFSCCEAYLNHFTVYFGLQNEDNIKASL